MPEVQLKKKICLRRKEKPAEFTFSKFLKIKLLWKSNTDLDLCLFYTKKDGQSGGVFSSMFRQKKSDMGDLQQFPYILHTGDKAEPSQGDESVEQINISNLDEMDVVNIIVLNYGKAINGEEVNFAEDTGRVEIQSSEGDYFEVNIDASEMGHVYYVCSIKNKDGINAVLNEGVVMDLGTAYEKIPGFSLICE